MTNLERGLETAAPPANTSSVLRDLLEREFPNTSRQLPLL
jgi:hypothetical protein